MTTASDAAKSKAAAATLPAETKSSGATADVGARKPGTKKTKRASKSPTKKRAKIIASPSPSTKSSSSSTKATRLTPPPSHILLIDNGGDRIKYGIISALDNAEDATTLPHSMPNLTAKLRHQWTVLVGDQVHTVQPTQLETQTRSMERGCITNLGNQVQVWKRMLDHLLIQVPMQTELAQTYGWNIARNATKKTKEQETKPIYAPQNMAVVIMLSPLCPRTIMQQVFSVWFQEFQFSHVGLVSTPAFGGTAESPTDCCCVVDLGWSASQVVPLYQDKIIGPVQRLPLGGRHLIGLWKYYCSYRQWNLMDADSLLQSVNEALGYVSLDFKTELREGVLTSLGKRPFDREFVLPDYQTTHKGFVRLTPQLLYMEKEQHKEEEKAAKLKVTEAKESSSDEKEEPEFSDKDDNDDYEMKDKDDGDENSEEGEGSNDDNEDPEEEVDSDDETDEQRHKRLLQQRQQEERRRRELEAERQVLLVSVERFTIPEVLFHPSDAGFSDMAGLPRVICNAIQACPRIYQSALYSCIRLIGGVALTPNMTERLQREIRTLAPTQYKVQVQVAEDPVHDAWMQAKLLIQRRDVATYYSQWSISRDEFEAKPTKDDPNKKPWDRLLDKKLLGKLV